MPKKDKTRTALLKQKAAPAAFFHENGDRLIFATSLVAQNSFEVLVAPCPHSGADQAVEY